MQRFLLYLLILQQLVKLLSIQAFSQSMDNTSFQYPDTSKVISLSFSRLLNTFQWNGIANGVFDINNWNVRINQTINSRLFRSSNTSLQDDYNGSVQIQKPLFPWLRWSYRNTSQLLHTNQAFDVGSMSSHRFLTGVVVTPYELWETGIEYGYERNRQASINDEGAAVYFFARNPLIKLEEFYGTLNAEYEISNLRNRNPYSGGIHVTLSRKFAEEIIDSFSISYTTQKREFYTFSEQINDRAYGYNILTRYFTHLQLTNVFSYRSKILRWRISGVMSNRDIDRSYRYKYNTVVLSGALLDYQILDLQFGIAGSVEWNFAQWWQVGIGFQYSEREESHSVADNPFFLKPIVEKQRADVRRLENIAKRTALSIRSVFNPSENDNIVLNSSVSILRYDTPDTTNVNDRDELWINAGIEYTTVLSKELTLSVRTDVYIDRLVYLSSKQSANNNWNRVYRFECQTFYKPSGTFRTLLRGEVLANYTISDYENKIPSIKSFSFRQLRFDDSTVISITKRFFGELFATLRLSERGILKWKEFREKPEQFYYEYSLAPRIGFMPVSSVKINVGYKLFVQERYRYFGKERIPEQTIRSVGPTVLCLLETYRYRLLLDGWMEQQIVQSTVVSKIPNMVFAVSYFL